MEAVVGEVFAELTVLVNEERVEVYPSYALALTHLFHSPVAVDYHLLAVFEEFPHLHVGVERQHRLQVDFGARRALLNEDDEFFHRSSYAVAINAVRHVIHATENENLAWLALENRLHALIESLHDVANDAAVLDIRVVEQLVPLGAVGEAVAQHDDVVTIDGQVVEMCCSTNVVFVLIGGALRWLRLQCSDCRQRCYQN